MNIRISRNTGTAVAALSVVMTGSGAVIPGAAQAQQNYPAKPIRIIYPFLAGTGNDGYARVIAQRLSLAWGQPAVMENRPGAGGTIGTESVIKSAPDGYTLLIVTASVAVNATLMPRIAVRELVPVTQINSTGVVIVAHPSVPARNLQELLALAKSRKEGLNFGSNGVGTTSHLAGAWLQQLSGARITHVPYKGESAAVPAVIGGDVEIAIPGTGSIPQLIATKKLRAIAVTMKRRSQDMPDVPTVASIFPEFEIDNWLGMFAPPGTTASIVEKLQREVAASLQLPEVRKAVARPDHVVMGNASAEFGAFFIREIEKYARIIKAAGIKADG